VVIAIAVSKSPSPSRSSWCAASPAAG